MHVKMRRINCCHNKNSTHKRKYVAAKKLISSVQSAKLKHVILCDIYIYVCMYVYGSRGGKNHAKCTTISIEKTLLYQSNLCTNHQDILNFFKI